MTACFEHSNFLKVIDLEPSQSALLPTQLACYFHSIKSRSRHPEVYKDLMTSTHDYAWTSLLTVFSSDYELFNRNSFNIRYWSWNYRGCWHQTCPPVAFVKGFKLYSFVWQIPNETYLLICCHYLGVSPVGNLRACCLPWKW